MKPLVTICLDFDGTCVEHEYPNIGPDLKGCVEILQKWTGEYNIGLILDTMRSGKELKEAIQWFEERNIPLYGIGKHPTQHLWTESPKAHATFSIDDRNVGAPLDRKGFIDWTKINEIMELRLQWLK